MTPLLGLRRPTFDRDRVALDRCASVADVRALAHHVCAARGGQGAARECCDLILLATGHYRRLLQGHAQTLDTTAEGPRT